MTPADGLPGDWAWAHRHDRCVLRHASGKAGAGGKTIAVPRNRPAMGYVLGCGAHCFALYGVRTCIVAFWAFVAGQNTGAVPLGPVAPSASSSRCSQCRHPGQRGRATLWPPPGVDSGKRLIVPHLLQTTRFSIICLALNIPRMRAAISHDAAKPAGVSSSGQHNRSPQAAIWPVAQGQRASMGLDDRLSNRES